MGSGGTGGTWLSSAESAGATREAARSRTELGAPPWPIEISLLALFRLAFPEDCRPETAETDVLLVATDSEAESRELVGVLVYVPDDAEPLLGVKLERALAVPVFFVDRSGWGEL